MNDDEDEQWLKTLKILKMVGLFICIYIPIRLVTGFIGNMPKYGVLIATGLITFGIYQTFMQGDER